MTDTFKITLCPPNLRREALLHLAKAQSPDGQKALTKALKPMLGGPETAWQSLWVSQVDGHINGVIWVQRLPLNMAQLWLPNVEGDHINALIETARQWVVAQRLTLCHIELSPDATHQRAQLLGHGMQPLVSLRCLKATVNQRFPTTASDTRLRWVPWDQLSPAQQHALLTAVGHGSLDCRLLRDILSVDDLSAGFYQQDTSAPAHWYALYVAESPSPIGALLLAPRREINRWELMLMGLVPKWRGHGLGGHILNHALALAQQAGASELLLSVDHENHPAVNLYTRTGFSEYAQQHVLAWRG
ncbi:MULTISPECIES: GNAT family N-acetyltransferase [unclassified Halomonas]|uniref:GNAT family N-acetyltransferase n=1 Tax=unclassified Halomonas TaxID=2609666 RepID=UPI0006DAE48C|nr:MULTISPECIES: GNAT family N-acetyltransferase [unclassified Halomonas]KPQ27198.1 MAG: putative acetyltransferase [Halomonas sp. HL-93]SBR52612.1 Acetyltransferase (GNAT) family protein [Halomonas sp. HL-93]SNY97931.1 Acetyltransferase (GNAT) family protein [Halomonas sp. hl-4]